MIKKNMSLPNSSANHSQPRQMASATLFNRTPVLRKVRPVYTGTVICLVSCDQASSRGEPLADKRQLGRECPFCSSPPQPSRVRTEALAYGY